MRSNLAVVSTLAFSALAGACSSVSEPVEPQRELSIIAGDDQEAVTANGSQSYIGNGAFPDSLRVRVTDASGAPVQGVSVAWTAGAGSLSPATSTTDADGVASARWSLYEPATGYMAVGSHTARATVGPTSRVTFTGHARAGIVARQVTFSPATVNIAGGAASTTVAVDVTDDRRDAAPTHVSVQFYNPSATSTQFQSVIAPLALSSGTASYGTWTGTVTIPADAETGAWTLGRLTLGWGCGAANRVELPQVTLAKWHITHLLNVVSSSAAHLSAPAMPIRATGAAEAATAGC